MILTREQANQLAKDYINNKLFSVEVQNKIDIFIETYVFQVIEECAKQGLFECRFNNMALAVKADIRGVNPCEYIKSKLSHYNFGIHKYWDANEESENGSGFIITWK